MNISMSGWAAAACIWGLVTLVVYLWRISVIWVQAYRIRRGRMQMNEWLTEIGAGLDKLWVDGTPYSKDAVKKWLAEMSVLYFKYVIKKNTKPPE